MKSLLNYSRNLAILAIASIIVSGTANASDERLVGFWERTNTTDPSARWTLNAPGEESTFDVDFGPEIPGFVLRTRFTWSTDSANKVFTYTVTYQETLGEGPYSYSEPIPNKTYSESYTLEGGATGIWHVGQYAYAKKAASGSTIYDQTHVINFWNLSGSGIKGDLDGIGSLAKFGFTALSGVTIDALGNAIVADTGNHKIRKIDPDGKVTTIAGTGSPGKNNGPGAQATFNTPTGIDSDENGNIYVADSGNHMIRKIAPDGTVTTLAGSGVVGSTNGLGSDASFAFPEGVAVAPDGQVWVADTNNNMVRKISPDGFVSSYGTGQPLSSPETGGLHSPSTLSFLAPHAIEVSPTGIVYVAEFTKIRWSNNYNGWGTYIGTDQSGDSDGFANEARFRNITGMTLNPSGGILVADGSRIRLAGGSGSAVITVAGSESPGDVSGTGRFAKFTFPAAMSQDQYGNLYVLDAGNFKLKKGSWAQGSTTQKITFSAPSSLSASAAPFNLKGSSSSQLPVTFQLLSGPAQLLGNRVTLTGGQGQVVIRAIQEGNGKWASAPPVIQKIQIQSPVAGPPSILEQPVSASISPGNMATLTVNARGASLTYQWYEGASGSTASPVAGVTQAFWTTPGLASGKSYWVRVSNAAGHTDSSAASIKVVTLSSGAAVSASVDGNFLFLLTNGSVWRPGAWTFDPGVGSKGYYKMDNIMNGVSAIDAGSNSSLCLRPDGSLWSIALYDQGAPIQVMTGIAAVAAGPSYTYHLKTDGSVWTTSYNNPTPQQLINGVKAMAMGSPLGAFTNFIGYFLKADGSLLAYGDPYIYAKRGSHEAPFIVDPNGHYFQGPIATNVVSVAAGQEGDYTFGFGQTLFVKSDGSAWAWGENSSGQIGNGSTTDCTEAVNILSGVKMVAAGSRHSFFLKTDGTLWATGSNTYGQLGNGSTSSILSPAKVATGISWIGASGNRSFCIKSDGSIWAWGEGIKYLFGSPTTTAGGDATPNPIQVNLGQTIPKSTVAPTDLWLRDSDSIPTVGNPTVCRLAGLDSDSVIFAYTLVAGPGQTDNSLFAIQGDRLVARNPSSLAPGTYSVRMMVKDESGNSFTKPLAVSISGYESLNGNIIAFGPQPDHHYPGKPFRVLATASSGLPVVFKVIHGPATISGNTLTLIGNGTVLIIATQSGNNSRSPAQPVVRAFNVTKASSVAILSKLAIQGSILSPKFTSSTTTYTAKVPNATKSIKITPTAKSAAANITINRGTVKSGSSKDIAVKTGKNTISILVTAEDGSKKTYKITVTRAAANHSQAASNFAPALADEPTSVNSQWKAITSIERIAGLNYLTMTVLKSKDSNAHLPTIEVSPNLIDWYSGEDHTTILTNNSSMLKVHDNTPLKEGRKRYIRLHKF